MSTVNSTSVSPSMSPSSLGHAPKFGTRIPNRVFVGGISSSTTETELYDLFAAYGEVRATKIIADRAGISKGYGFVTFATEEDAESILKEDAIMLRDRKLNIAPAVRKQPISRYFGSQDFGSDTTGSSARLTPSATPEWNVTPPEPAQVLSNGTVFYHNGTPYVYPNGGYILATAAADGTCQPAQAYYPVMYSPTLYIPQQQYQYPSPTTAQTQWTGQQLRWAAQVNYGQNPSPQVSAASTPHYVYTTNGSSSNTTVASAAVAANTSTSSSSSLVQQHQMASSKGAAGDSVVGIAAANGCPSALAYTAAAYAYTALPPHQLQHNIYQQIMTQPQIQDYVDTPPPMMEAANLDGPPSSYPSQDSACATESRAVQHARHTSIRYARPPPPPPSYYQGGGPNADINYRPMPAPYDHNNNNSSNISNVSNNGGDGGRGYQRRGQHQQHSYGRPRFHYKSMSYNDGLHQNKCPLTPPATPMAGDGSSSSKDLPSVTNAVKKMETMAI